MLVAEHVLHFALVHWHTAGVGEVHGAALVAVPVLQGVVLLFTQLGELLESRLVRQVSDKALLGGLILEHVHKSTLLISSQGSKQWHQFFKLLLMLSMSFNFGARLKVQHFDHFLE